MTDLTQLRPGARVVTPGGVCGTVEAISARPSARWPILVRRDDGTTRSCVSSATAQQQRGQGL